MCILFLYGSKGYKYLITIHRLNFYFTIDFEVLSCPGCTHDYCLMNEKKLGLEHYVKEMFPVLYELISKYVNVIYIILYFYLLCIM